MTISLFPNSKGKVPSGTITVNDWLAGIKAGKWQKQIVALRDKNDKAYKSAKARLPGVTVSALLKTRDVSVPLEDKLVSHSGFIAIDIDKKDNPAMRARDLVDKDCYAQFVSPSGEGKKVIYRCKPVKSAAEHRRIYDAVIARLVKKGIKLKVDPVVKSIMSLQFCSYDPDAYFNFKTKLVVQPLPPVKVNDRLKPALDDVDGELKKLAEHVQLLDNQDITKSYEDWMIVLFGLSYSFGEKGRTIMHEICANYPDYNRDECDEKYDACLERRQEDVVNPVTVASVYQLINNKLPKVTLKHLAKKYNASHAVGVGEDVEGGQQGDIGGLVRYKLFLFRKIFDRETNTLLELVPISINLNEFEKLLRACGFARYGKLFVHVVDNVVETVDIPDILRIITARIEGDGDYRFLYKKVEFLFSWEELAHLWRIIRAQGTTANQVAASLDHWDDSFILADEPTASYIPYQNCVVKVTAKKIEQIPYDKIKAQIWRERILPRPFHYTEKPGMFEEFFANTAGRGKNTKDRVTSSTYQRAVWYYGYILQGTKRQSTARAWILYDTKPGNNGRTGKTIIGQAVGKIRCVTTIDGKQVDFRNRFAFQTVTPWTDIVFIDDPSKYMSLVPLFNMISGTMSADRKGLTPIEKPVKFLIASNWVLEGEGTSETGRQFVTQLEDYYVQYAKEHGNTLTPIVHKHGKEFFTDWNEGDWAAFDSFSVRAIQAYLAKEAPEEGIVGNSQQLRFIQLYEEELFFELCMLVCSTVQHSKDGSYLLAQSMLIAKIAEHGTVTGDIKAGRVARAFLASIGAQNLVVSSMVVGGGVTKMAYKFNLPEIGPDFGNYKNRLNWGKK